MHRQWQKVTSRYQARLEGMPGSPYRQAICALERVSCAIGEGPIAADLYPWTSVDALCIQQTNVPPFTGPYLALTPLADGSIEFRYVDTAIERRQWKRIESPETALASLDHVIAQLHWRVDFKST